MSKAQLRAWADPVVRANRLAALRSAQYRQWQSRRSKSMWLDPDMRPKLIAAQSARAKGRPAPNRVVFTPEMDSALRDLRTNGMPWRMIADRIGVDVATLKRRVDQLGIPRKHLTRKYRRPMTHEESLEQAARDIFAKLYGDWPADLPQAQRIVRTMTTLGDADQATVAVRLLVLCREAEQTAKQRRESLMRDAWRT